jgi:hypothetical protein
LYFVRTVDSHWPLIGSFIIDGSQISSVLSVVNFTIILYNLDEPEK